MRYAHAKTVTLGIVLCGVVIAGGAAAVGGQDAFPTHPLRVIDDGATSAGPWTVLLGQSASGPYMRFHHNGGSWGIDAGAGSNPMRALASNVAPEESMVYGAVDDTVARVTLHFIDGTSQELEFFRLEDVGFFYGIVAAERRVDVVEMVDVWGRRVGTADCEHDSGDSSVLGVCLVDAA